MFPKKRTLAEIRSAWKQRHGLIRSTSIEIATVPSSAESSRCRWVFGVVSAQERKSGLHEPSSAMALPLAGSPFGDFEYRSSIRLRCSTMRLDSRNCSFPRALVVFHFISFWYRSAEHCRDVDAMAWIKTFSSNYWWANGDLVFN